MKTCHCPICGNMCELTHDGRMCSCQVELTRKAYQEELEHDCEDDCRTIPCQVELTRKAYQEELEMSDDFNKLSNDYRIIQMGDFFVTPRASDIIDRLRAFKRLDLPACWIFEGDDGPEHHATCASLLRYLADFNGKLIYLGPHSVEHIRHEDSAGIGRFLVQLD